MLLYNKYRSTRFDEVIGQEHITDSLKGLIKTGNYKDLNSIIFACNKAGSSKTTISRIFAKAANCQNRTDDGEPCGECDHCKQFESKLYPDYIEIDGASYNKVEDIKQIVEIANTYPQVPGGTRFILIDECHRLSNAAWDVMLKLLEEGNNYTVFLLATTELHNVRSAIISRSFVYNLVPLKYRDIYKLLKNITKKENIEYDDDILKQIAIDNEGKTRDAIRALDMVYKSYGKVDRYNSEKTEDLVANCMIKAFIGNIDEARNDADKLIKISDDINSTISQTLFSIYSYKEGSQYVTQELAEEAYNTFKDMLTDIIQDFLTYKPDTIEQFKLFLTILAGKGIKVQDKTSEVAKSSRKRRLIEKENVAVVSENVGKVRAKPTSKENTVGSIATTTPGRAKIESLAEKFGFKKA